MHEGILVALNRPSAETRIAIIETFEFAGDMPCICGFINNFHAGGCRVRGDASLSIEPPPSAYSRKAKGR